jgi:peptidoglycan/LPS O-acetylase OafA/YrhL
MAVDGFFAISGFLVAGSLLNRGTLDYTLSRALRILPGLTVCVLLTVFLLGPLLSSLSIGDYFSSKQTWTYLNNAWALPSTVFQLPGVFEGQQHGSINGSLWSIPYEVRCYIALGIAGLIGLLRNRDIANRIAAVLSVTLLWSYAAPASFGLLPHVSSALLCFVIGVLIFLNRGRLLLDLRLMLAASLALYFSFGEPWFKYVYPLVWPYILFNLAYRTRFIDLDKRVGDCSFGIYIYAYPVQQTTAFLVSSGTPYTNLVISTAVVIPMAVLSWHYIEKPALALKARYLTHRPAGSYRPLSSG